MKRKILIGTCLILNLIGLCSCNKNKLGNEIDNYNGRVFYNVEYRTILGFENEYMYLNSHYYGLSKYEFDRETSEYYYYKALNSSSSYDNNIFFKNVNTLKPNICIPEYVAFLTNDFILDTEKIYTLNDCKKVI